MSEKLSERAARIGGFWLVEFAPEIAALEQQLAAKDAEIARLRTMLEHDRCALAAASEKAASEEVAQASNELGTCDILSEPHETGFTYSPTHLHLCSNWRPLPKGDAK